MPAALRLLAVFAHPDDESLGAGGALAKYAAEGVDTYLVCATRGERGWNGAPDQFPGFEALGRLREAELACAARTLGLQEVNYLDYLDGDLDQANPQQAIAKITGHIRRLRPQVVITFPPDGIYGHPDHIAISQFTAAAVLCAADAGYRDPDDQPPYRVAKFYYMVDSQAVVQAARQTLGGISMEIDGVERQHIGWEAWAITTRLDVRPHFDRLWAAILCHQSQLAGYGAMIDLPRPALLDIWGEATYVRVYSLVNGGRQVETDLFAGLRRPAA